MKGESTESWTDTWDGGRTEDRVNEHHEKAGGQQGVDLEQSVPPLGAASWSWLAVNRVLWTCLVPHGGDVEEELDHYSTTISQGTAAWGV